MENSELRDKVLSVIPSDTIGRYDLFPVFRDAKLFSQIVSFLAEPYIGKVDYIASPEAVGWILGTALARELGVGFIPIRKGGRLPYRKEELFFVQYEDYSQTRKTLEINKEIDRTGIRVLIADEWIETGASVKSCMELLENAGFTTVGLAAIGVNYRESTKAWIDTEFVTCVGID